MVSRLNKAARFRPCLLRSIYKRPKLKARKAKRAFAVPFVKLIFHWYIYPKHSKKGLLTFTACG
jgi:hypothetical protein